jgi:hypothetical protein
VAASVLRRFLIFECRAAQSFLCAINAQPLRRTCYRGAISAKLSAKSNLMKLLAYLALITVVALPLSAAEGGLAFKPADTIATVLVRQEGQKVELRLRSGEKIGGKLEKVGDKLVHLSQLVGAELLEAVIAVDEIAAVVVRAKAN